MAYLGKSPNGSGVRTKFVYTASGSETSLSGADDNGNTLKFTDGEYVDVYLNGVLLVHGSDYGTGTTNTISSLNALTASDVVEILVYDIFTMAKVNSEVIRSRYYKTASGSETSISGADDSGATITFAANAEIEVKVNGVSLVQGTDYNTSSANTVGGLSALTAGQVVEIIVYTKFTLGDTVSKADGGTFGGNIGINGDLTVDTTTLKVDSSNNRVGIGTASPAVLIHGTASAPELRITSSSDSNTPAARMFYTGGSGWNFRLGDAANNEDVKISTHGDSYFNGGNIGIGTSSPVGLLDLDGGSSAFTMQFKETSGAYQRMGFQKSNDQLNIGEFNNAGSSFTSILTVSGNGDKVGVGVTAPEQPLHVRSSTFAYIRSESTNATYTGLDVGQHQDGYAVINMRDNQDIRFYNNDTERWRINTAGHMVPGNSNNGIVLGTTSSSASNLLNDYEVGTFTPTIDGGVSSATYSQQVGRYTKIGNLVHYSLHLDGNSVSASTGQIQFGGLPFTALNVAHVWGGGFTVYTGGSFQKQNVTWAIQGGTTRVIGYNNNGAVFRGTDFDTLNGGWYINGFYYTA